MILARGSKAKRTCRKCGSTYAASAFATRTGFICKWCKDGDKLSPPSAMLEKHMTISKGCDHCLHPLWAGIRCGICGRWAGEGADPQFECPRCGHCCKQEEQKLRRLHAANQELLEALKQCAVLIHGGNRQGDAAITAARAVIAKAEGA